MIRKIILILFLTLLNIFAIAQHQITNLVFEGAGIRGIAYAGAINALDQRNVLQHIERVGGTSAGAITALLVSIGYTSEEIKDIIHTTSFRKFNDGHLFFPGGITRLKKYFGWYRGKRFNDWLKVMIANKTGFSDLTFAQLEQKGFKKLYVTATSLTAQEVIIFSAENFPNVKIADAVRMSMNIPLYFEPIYMNNQGDIFYRPKVKEGLHLMVDGGFTANFPIRLFDSTKYMGETTNKFIINPQTLGFRIDREEQIINDTSDKKLAPMSIKNLNDYVAAFYNIVIENLNRQDLTDDDWKRTVSISDGRITPRIRKLKGSEVEKLTANGSLSTTKFLDSNFK
jgi:NTE family protein